MKAPDKIYVKEFDKGISQMWSSIRATETTANVQHEYIRKEALLEWANKRLEEFRYIAKISNDVAADGEVDAFEELIDKLNSM